MKRLSELDLQRKRERHTRLHGWSPESHAPAVGWRGSWRGKTWRDMGGKDIDEQKLNFALFRRGLYDDPKFIRVWWESTDTATTSATAAPTEVKVPDGGWKILADQVSDPLAKAREVAMLRDRERIGRGGI